MMDWGRVYLWTLPFTAGWQVMAGIVNFATDDPILGACQFSLAAMFLLYGAQIRRDRDAP